MAKGKRQRAEGLLLVPDRLLVSFSLPLPRSGSLFSLKKTVRAAHETREKKTEQRAKGEKCKGLESPRKLAHNSKPNNVADAVGVEVVPRLATTIAWIEVPGTAA